MNEWMALLTSAGVFCFGWWIFSREMTNSALGLALPESSFIRSVSWLFIQSLFLVSPRSILDCAQNLASQPRLRMFVLGLRSMGYAFLFIFLFGLLAFISSGLWAVLSLLVLVVYTWFRRGRSLVFILGSLALMSYGLDELARHLSLVMTSAQPDEWLYLFTTNYFAGTLHGLAIGFGLRLVLRLSGFAWGLGWSLLLSGVASLGLVWGLVLGDFLCAALEDTLLLKDRIVRQRLAISLVFAFTFLCLSPWYQPAAMTWIKGEYSVQLRAAQWATMIFVFLFAETAAALGYFHFAYHRQKAN